MSRVVHLPPETSIRPDGMYAGGWWHDDAEQGRIVCDLCPRECHLKAGDRGFCFVRQNLGGEMVLSTYGRSTGFCIDPIEKKPLNHFLPGTSVLSFGTAGCNLGCKFCQNWDISKSREVERLSELATPEAIAKAAQHFQCHSVAYTYNDPVIWAEYAIDTAKACRAAGIRNVAVTAGYISPGARAPFYEYMDAANVDLKAFTEEFYHKITYSHLQPVLDTLEWLKKETSVWFEITNLVIPDANDAMDEIRQMSDWILEHVGDEVPLHFTGFHPDFRMRDRPSTPHETLIEARDVARKQGLKHVYTGNVNDVANQSTYCPGCGELLIERNWYELGVYRLDGNRCRSCQQPLAGVFEKGPGNWGRKRLPVQISQFIQPSQSSENSAAKLARNIQPEGENYRLPVIANMTHREESTMSSGPHSSGAAARIQAQRPKLTSSQEKSIFRAACEVIAAAIQKRQEKLPDPTLDGAADRTVMGAFVTLKRQGKLRACCGALGRPMPLIDALRESALRTATDDTRLPPISITELPYLEVDVQLLYGFQEIAAKGPERAQAVEAGKHGLQIRQGERGGLLLPAVASEQGYNAEEFLRQVCRKAGLSSTAWENDDAVIQTFEAVEVPGKFDEEAIVVNAGPAQLMPPQELHVLVTHCGTNLAALARGATPSYYVPGVSDGTVHGIALSLKPSSGTPIHFFRMTMRPGMPLQSTLFSLTETAANALKSGQIRLAGGNVAVALTLLHDPAMHGTADEPDLRGLDPQRRALLITEGGKSAWIFDPTKTADELLTSAKEQINVFNPAATSLFSLAAQSTDKSVVFSNAPRAMTGASVRQPAVAGTFYPGDATELDELVTSYLGPPTAKKSVPAVMVPHAGLQYSGRIAAQVLNQIEIPDTVIVIGPKHTRLGVEWAIAPHEKWLIPGAELESDVELARELVSSIPGLQLDAAAHAQEHGIEVELPFLAKLAPRAKVVGIVIGAGDLDDCRTFALGLAKVLKNRQSQGKILLIVSSDMNHYANDAETRKLDEIAMQSLEQLEPARVYETVREHNISMCGLLPAVIVMETLKQLNELHHAERIAYATSADASGDTSRVVGYCGMLFR
jgi:AmmeMemoRadiSam system radical SAM enzyme/AmmeMemoRadiSam system protein B/AmmeMemoRadiSam system protein A